MSDNLTTRSSKRTSQCLCTSIDLLAPQKRAFTRWLFTHLKKNCFSWIFFFAVSISFLPERWANSCHVTCSCVWAIEKNLSHLGGTSFTFSSAWRNPSSSNHQRQKKLTIGLETAKDILNVNEWITPVKTGSEKEDIHLFIYYDSES